MDGFPVHNYGTNPLGQLGMNMINSSLEWGDEQKLLERQALNEAARANRETSRSLTEKGDFAGTPQDLVNQGYNPANAVGMVNQNKRQSVANYVKSLTDTADLSKKTQEYQNAEITKLQTSLEYWGKKKNEVMDLGGDVIGINDNLQIIGKQLSKLTGLEFDPVAITDLSEVKKYKEEVAIKRVSELQMSLNDLMAKGDLEGAAKAAGALGSQIMTSSKQLNLPKDTFAAANSALEKFQTELPKILQDKVKEKAEVTPKLEYRDLGDKVVALDTTGKVVKSYPKGATPSNPADEKDTTTKKNWMDYNKSLVEQGKKPVPYTFYVDNIASKFDLGKMLFGGGLDMPSGNTLPAGTAEPAAPQKVEVQGNFAVVNGKKYPIVKGVVTIDGKKFKVEK